MTHTITLNRSGVTIDGEPLYLLAGQVHYFRYPRAEWRALLSQAKAAGLNTIDTVIPWNLHEPREGQFDFAEEADLPGYLDLCHELGLWAIVRPGPYICAEWENGGFPAWLTAKRGLELRVDNEVFLHHTLRWFDQLFPILAERQATRGGPIILCQIENEHWASGRYGHDDHQQTLAQAAIERGMDVPQYTCMGATRDWAEFRNGWSGIAEKLVQTRALWPENPMIVSELWSGWFDNWGASKHTHKTAARLDIILHQLAAVGASGFSHWMWAGGTNFGYWGGRTVGGDSVHMTTSYDYDAPVTEYGGTTEKFYVARRHHLFLGTLGSPLVSVLDGAVAGGPKVIAPAAVAGRGEAGSAPYRNVRAGADVPPVWANFTATYLQNTNTEGQTYQLYLQRPSVHLAVEVEAHSIKPIFTNMPLLDTGWQLDYHTSRILGLWSGAPDTLVLYGFAGEVGEFQVRATQADVQVSGVVPSNVTVSSRSGQTALQYWITERPTVVRLRAGDQALDVVLITTDQAGRWWPLGDGAFMCGPDEVMIDNRRPTTGDGQAQVYAEATRRGAVPFYRIEKGTVQRQEGARAVQPDVVAPFELHWTRHDTAQRIGEEGWQSLEFPTSMEALDCDLGYGWYRATFELNSDTTLSLAVPALNDRARVIVDGEDRGWLGVHPHGPRMALELPLSAGTHDLRFFIDNLGRFNYGSNTGEQKGMLDTVYLGGQQYDLTEGWAALWQEASFAGEAIADAKPSFVRPDAENVSLANFAFQGPSVWLLRNVEITEGKAYVLHLTGDRNSGALFVNGVNVTRFSRHYGGGYIKVDITPLVREGTNTLALNIQNYAGLAWRATLLEYDPQQPLVAEWSFHPGVTPSDLNDEAPIAAPTYWRATFRYTAKQHGQGPFKLHVDGLRKGQIWLNGRNVGRYWSIGPQESYKLPASWLKLENQLLILDEEGASPEQVWIEASAISPNILL